jgi:hypothetical protein
MVIGHGDSHRVMVNTARVIKSQKKYFFHNLYKL